MKIVCKSMEIVNIHTRGRICITHGEIKNGYKISVEKPKGQNYLED
jgi:hypothetical protein